MSRTIFIFCEECGTRLEVDEADPKVFCEECGAEVENVRYRPEENDIFTASEEEKPLFVANEYREEVVEENGDDIVEEYQEPDLFEEYKDKYNIEEYTEEDEAIDEVLKTVPTSIFETAVKNNLIKNTVVNNYVTTETFTKIVSSTDPRNMEEKEDVKEIFVDHEYIENVTEGTPVTYYAVIERRGRFFTGECPEVPFTSVDRADSFEECVEEIKDELEERVNSFGGKDYPQPSYDELQSNYPQADIIEITVMKKR